MPTLTDPGLELVCAAVCRLGNTSISIVRERGPDYISVLDCLQNLGFVEGIPPSFSTRLPLDTPLGWHYQISGKYLTDAGGERYSFTKYAVDEANAIRFPNGGRAFTAGDFREQSFHIDDVSYAGDRSSDGTASSPGGPTPSRSAGGGTPRLNVTPIRS